MVLWLLTLVYHTDMSTPVASISIVCVYNDLDVRQECLDRSIEALSNEASDVEYLPVDNVNGSYLSAGTALNYGASLAKNDVVVFAHQDVFLHSLTALKEAAAQLQDPTANFGLLGAIGVGLDGRIVGRIRDRVVLLGDAVTRPTEVDSVDEVLFLASRSRLLREPLTESRDMAWHAYAIEYGLRLRGRGLRTGVANVPLTHNSLSINLDRLDVAHGAIAARYANLLPVRTTCGVIAERTAKGGGAWFPSHRWRYRWLRESLALHKIPRAKGQTAAVLADIRRDVDGVIGRAPGRQLLIVNRSSGSSFVDGSPGSLELARRAGKVLISSRDISDVQEELDNLTAGSWLLLTNLSKTDLKVLRSLPPATPSVLGFHTGIGFWLLLGAPFTDLPPQWRSKKAAPFGMRTLITELGSSA
jgi:hypothetical protein